MAAANLGLLMQVSVRVDPLIGDIVSGVKSGEGGVRQAMMKALAEVLGHAATSPSEKSLALVEQCVSEQIAQQRGAAPSCTATDIASHNSQGKQLRHYPASAERTAARCRRKGEMSSSGR